MTIGGISPSSVLPRKTRRSRETGRRHTSRLVADQHETRCPRQPCSSTLRSTRPVFGPRPLDLGRFRRRSFGDDLRLARRTRCLRVRRLWVPQPWVRRPWQAWTPSWPALPQPDAFGLAAAGFAGAAFLAAGALAAAGLALAAFLLGAFGAALAFALFGLADLAVTAFALAALAAVALLVFALALAAGFDAAVLAAGLALFFAAVIFGATLFAAVFFAAGAFIAAAFFAGSAAFLLLAGVVFVAGAFVLAAVICFAAVFGAGVFVGVVFVALLVFALAMVVPCTCTALPWAGDQRVALFSKGASSVKSSARRKRLAWPRSRLAQTLTARPSSRPRRRKCVPVRSHATRCDTRAETDGVESAGSDWLSKGYLNQSIGRRRFVTLLHSRALR